MDTYSFAFCFLIISKMFSLGYQNSWYAEKYLNLS